MALLVTSAVGLLRGEVIPTKEARPFLRLHKNRSVCIDVNLDEGERFLVYLARSHGSEEAADFLKAAATEKCIKGLPYGFYRRYMEEELQTTFTLAKREALRRSFRTYAIARVGGGMTRVAQRGYRKVASRRGGRSGFNSLMCPELSDGLLVFFVDFVQNLYTRADSTLMLEHARKLRAYLLAQGVLESTLPKLIGNAGAQWFRAWRYRCGITFKTTGMKLKVSWQKILRRCKVLLTNIFRLRRFWEFCHPGVEMRFISLDQKPSWFNNAGHKGTFAKKGNNAPGVKENFAQTRERYTIFTSVRSWGNEDKANPPPVAVLFAGKPKGAI